MTIRSATRIEDPTLPELFLPHVYRMTGFGGGLRRVEKRDVRPATRVDDYVLFPSGAYRKLTLCERFRLWRSPDSKVRP